MEPAGLGGMVLALFMLGFLIVGPILGMAVVGLIATLWEGLGRLRPRGRQPVGTASSSARD